jgi:hypothetical protein
MRAAGDESFGQFGDEPRARRGDLSAPRSARGRRADPLAALGRFVAESAVDEAARARARLRWQQQLALEESSWLGLLCDLADTGQRAVLATTLGRRLAGVLCGAGRDFVCVRTADHGIIVVAIAAVTAIERVDRQATPSGRSTAHSDVTLRELLRELVAERPVVTWQLDDRDAITGRLVGVGEGFVQLRIDGDPPSTSYVPIGDRAMIGLDG